MAKVQRQLPHPTEIFDLIKFKKLDLNLKRARLSDAQTIDDLRKIAKRRTPAAAFDYTDGAADDEISMNRARQAFKDVEFHPSILNDVSNVDTSCEVFGGPSALPFGIAPTGVAPPPPRPAGEVYADVRFSYDINGLLDVDISNDDFDIRANQTFRHNSANLSEEQIQASLAKLAALKVHPREQQENVYLLEKAKRLYEEYLGDQRQTIGHALAQFERVLESQDPAAIRRAQKEFGEFLERYDGGWLL